MWTRRDLLRAVGAGATLAALTPLGCGAAARPLVTAAALDRDRLREALRAAVDRLGEHLDAPFAFAGVRRRVRALVDLDRRGLFVEERMIAIVGGRDGQGRWRERGTDDLSPAGIAAAAAAVAADGGAGAAIDRARRLAVDHADVVRDPRAISRRAWLGEADALAARIAAHASSRIIYRAAWLVSDDEEAWIVDGEVDHRQRIVRGRVGAGLVTWHGRRPMAGEAVVAARGVPTAPLVTDDAIAAAADEALTLYTPGGAPTGPHTLVLAPRVVAGVLDRLLATPAVAARVRPAAALTLVDDPTADAAFAGHAVDDAGRPARPITLASGGAPIAALPAGSARRGGPRWQLERAPTHLALAAGAATAAALEGAVIAGVVLDGVRDLRLDDDGYLVVRVARARELARGQRTGRVWGDLELRGDVGELLAGVLGVSSERAAVALADDGAPRDALVPWLVTRGELAAGAVDDARGDG